MGKWMGGKAASSRQLQRLFVSLKFSDSSISSWSTSAKISYLPSRFTILRLTYVLPIKCRVKSLLRWSLFAICRKISRTRDAESTSNFCQRDRRGVKGFRGVIREDEVEKFGNFPLGNEPTHANVSRWKHLDSSLWQAKSCLPPCESRNRLVFSGWPSPPGMRLSAPSTPSYHLSVSFGRSRLDRRATDSQSRHVGRLRRWSSKLASQPKPGNPDSDVLAVPRENHGTRWRKNDIRVWSAPWLHKEAAKRERNWLPRL